jgi:hypothetical protein
LVQGLVGPGDEGGVLVGHPIHPPSGLDRTYSEHSIRAVLAHVLN